MTFELLYKSCVYNTVPAGKIKLYLACAHDVHDWLISACDMMIMNNLRKCKLLPFTYGSGGALPLGFAILPSLPNLKLYKFYYII